MKDKCKEIRKSDKPDSADKENVKKSKWQPLLVDLYN